MPDFPTYDEKEMLQLVAAGDQEAFTLLFHRYRKKVATIAFTLTRSQILSEELVQDIFLNIWLGRHRLPEVEKFESYLFIATRNECYRCLKKIAAESNRKLEVGEDLVSAQPFIEDPLLEKQYQELLHKAVEQLPPQQQQAYQLIKEEGMSREQAAEQMGLHPYTVKTHLAQAMRRIRAFCMAHIELVTIWAILFPIF